MLDMLDEIRQKYDLSILFSTHDFSTLRHYADKVILLQQTILKTGTPGEVLSSRSFARCSTWTWERKEQRAMSFWYWLVSCCPSSGPLRTPCSS